jgi:hypothetical protein
MRRPLHFWLLFAVVPATAALLFWAVDEGYGPYDDFSTFRRSEVIPRPGVYTALPPYDNRYGWTCFNGWESQTWYGKVMVLDMPHWPGGDPGRGRDNPMPPTIERCYIYGINSWLPASAAVLLWVGWVLVFVRHRATRPAAGKGFEVRLCGARPGAVPAADAAPPPPGAA